MDEQTKLERDIEALDKCIVHWDELSRCKSRNEITAAGGYGVRGCALCQIYNRAGNPDGYCGGCPVSEHSGEPFCYGTPHTEAETAGHQRDYPAFRVAAVRMWNYLQTIRDKLTPPEELVTESHNIWIIVSSYGQDEQLRTFKSEEAMLLQVREDYQIDDAIPLDSKAFWEAVADGRVYTAARIDAATGEHHIYGGK